ncbi:TetR/AcrR family transcriptional regulator [Demequina lignilytica]|uniref:TetR/AcrR family transcriptional regulator n=1 Tax=Demequina lignilytica TaxID=3051663 RepID=A0AB35ML34_9MICO|nr:TetR/AcrR family transcriptional regulator [Demequina sp. SYSU T0a273]MDN4484426.1 TetR/AcrR family transcriptional regulator [Demequina sp. SYSU T0a273]
MFENENSDLRGRLLEGALRIVDTQGAAGLTVRAVAAAAGCSTMGVYTHFKGKSGLIDAVVEWGFGQLDATLEEAHEAAGGGCHGLVAGARAYCEWSLAHPTQFQVMFVAAIPGYDPSETTRERVWDSFYAHRARVASALEGPDADPARWHDAAASLWANVHGHVMIEMLRRAYGDHRPELCDIQEAIEATVAGLDPSCAR